MRKREIARMRIENKCEWEKSDVSSDSRVHACILVTGSSPCRKEGSGTQLYNKLKNHKICSRKDN